MNESQTGIRIEISPFSEAYIIDILVSVAIGTISITHKYWKIGQQPIWKDLKGRLENFSSDAFR